MTSEFDDLKSAHEVDQALAEAIELGTIRIAGKNPSGDDLLELTAKGVVSTALMFVQPILDLANAEKRDFTPKEKAELREHLKTVMQALNKK